jgi:hypothetical protein
MTIKIGVIGIEGTEIGIGRGIGNTSELNGPVVSDKLTSISDDRKKDRSRSPSKRRLV